MSLDINIRVGNLNCCSVPWTWERSSLFLICYVLCKNTLGFLKRSLISFCAVFSLCGLSPPSVCLKQYTESAECGFLLFHTHLKNSTKCEPGRDRYLVAWNVFGSKMSLSSSCWSLLIPKLLVTLLTLQCPLSPVCWCNCFWGYRLKISLQREVVFSF